MRRIFISGSLFIVMCLLPSFVVHGETGEEKKDRSLTGLLERVGSTVDGTLKSVGNVVESTVGGVGKTVEDTVSFTKGTVETLVDPSAEKRVTTVVQDTVKHLDSTVKNVTPVVENTTGTVKTVTSGVTEIVEELPNVPVVTPVVEKTVTVVDDTTGTVTGTVNEVVQKVEVAPLIERKPGDSSKQTDTEKPKHPSEPVKDGKLENEMEPQKPVPVTSPAVPSINENEVVEQPTLPSFNEESAITSAEQSTSLDDTDLRANGLNETIDLSVDATVGQVFIKPDASTASYVESSEKQVVIPTATEASDSSVAEESPAVPLRPSRTTSDVPAVMTPGASSAASVGITFGGHTDISPGILSQFAIQQMVANRQWVDSDEKMRIQWVHAPPGQPPQFAPFLQMNK